MAFTIKLDLGDLRAQMEKLGDQAEAAARPAAQAYAQVIYDEAIRNVSMIQRKTGNLASSIYQAYSQRHSKPGLATYHVSWNPRKAPHAMLVEFGHLQRYEYYQDDQGKVRPRVRPEMMGQPRPVSNSKNRAALDAYYVTLPTPKQVPARSFLRKALSAQPQAIEAAEKMVLSYIIKGAKP